MLISFVTVAQLRAVPDTWAIGLDSWAASSLRPYPSGVCRYSVRPTTTASSRPSLAPARCFAASMASRSPAV